MRSLSSRADETLRETVYATGFSTWKQTFVRDFLADMQVIFVRSVKHVPQGATLAVWGNAELAPDMLAGRTILRIEDGFIRSIGLGADLSRPLSLVVDACGLYFDATRPSGLESILQHTHFDAALLKRAASLHRRIVAADITKYNVGSGTWRRPAGARRVVLAVGQVEGDAALRYGAPQVRTDVGLLQAIRRRCPDAYVVYKPHPDVLAGLRAEGAGDAHAHCWCDEIVKAVPMSRLLAQVDEVHVMTSLAGFEALLRGREVTTYGQPFYSGWGLTNDVIPHPRRTRRLLLGELIAGALILYPRYVSPVSRVAISPEHALDLLVASRDAREHESATRRSLRTAWRSVVRLGLRTVTAHR